MVRGIAAILRPAVWLLSVSTNGLLRLMRLSTKAEEETVTEEEIRMMVDLGEARGTIEREEGEWIDNVFDFGESMARDLMTHAGGRHRLPGGRGGPGDPPGHPEDGPVPVPWCTTGT